MSLDEAPCDRAMPNVDLLALDEALTRLEASIRSKAGSSSCGSSAADDGGDRRGAAYLAGDGRARVDAGQAWLYAELRATAMNADQWARVKEISTPRSNARPEERDGVCRRACDGDAAVRAEVERLLAAHVRPATFIETSPVPVADRRTPTLTGHALGRYQVGRLIGAGGMGEVYAARDVELGRRSRSRSSIGAERGSADRAAA